MRHDDIPAPSQYLIIAGHGRSGSNRLLDAFDCHGDTFCRNEPNRPTGNPFLTLPDGFQPGLPSDFPAQWAAVINKASQQISVRDRLVSDGKSFVRSPLRKFISRHVFLRKRPRQIAALVAPSFRLDTCPAIPYYAEPNSLANIYPVLKVLLYSGWLIDAFYGDPRMKIILNIREPKAFLRSWEHRYVRHAGPESVFQDNLQTLPAILAHFNAESCMPQSYSPRALFESELWRWRYINEILLETLGKEERFTTITYDAYDKAPIEEIKRLYAFAGLTFDQEVEARAGLLRNTLFAPRAKQDYEHKDSIDAAVDTVLPGSSLQSFWA